MTKGTRTILLILLVAGIWIVSIIHASTAAGHSTTGNHTCMAVTQTPGTEFDFNGLK